MSTFAGIDLGSHYSAIAILPSDAADDVFPLVVANDDGDHQIPTFFAEVGGEEPLFGASARTVGIRKPRNSVHSFHRHVGRTHSDDIPLAHGLTVADDGKTLRYVFPIPVYNDDGDEIDTRECILTPEDITAKYVDKLKSWAENSAAGKPLDSAVVAISATADDAYKAALSGVMAAAGFKTTHVIEEPIAAALAFDHSSPKSKATTISLVVDFGARHLDVSAVARAHGVYALIDTMSDSSLGGQAVDEVLFEYVRQQFYRRTRLNVAEERRSSAKLRAACELTKRALSRSQSAMCSVEALMDGVDLNESVPSQRFEGIIQGLMDQCVLDIKKLMERAALTESDISNIILVGGSSRIPLFNSTIAKAFPKIPIRTEVDPEQAIAVGCALQAKVLSKPQFADARSKTHDMPFLQKGLGIKSEKGSHAKLFQRFTGLPAHQNVVVAIDTTAGNKDIYIPLCEEGDDSLIAELVLKNAIDDTIREQGKTTVSFTLAADGILHAHVHHKPIEDGVKLLLLQ